MTLCMRCKKRKATITYCDSIISYTHGLTENICKDCYRRKLKNIIKSAQNSLKELDGKKRT